MLRIPVHSRKVCGDPLNPVTLVSSSRTSSMPCWEAMLVEFLQPPQIFAPYPTDDALQADICQLKSLWGERLADQVRTTLRIHGRQCASLAAGFSAPGSHLEPLRCTLGRPPSLCVSLVGSSSSRVDPTAQTSRSRCSCAGDVSSIQMLRTGIASVVAHPRCCLTLHKIPHDALCRFHRNNACNARPCIQTIRHTLTLKCLQALCID